MTEKTMIARIPFIGVLFTLLFCAIAVPASAQTLTWTDPATGSMWTKSDNGSDVTWQEATDYCRNLQLVGYSDWHLPTFDELQGVYDPTPNAGGYHVKGNLQLSGFWHWTSSLGSESGQAWAITFISAKRNSGRFEASYDARALCVRR
jgi:hypothetical protein